jgi:hypothetical protein
MSSAERKRIEDTIERLIGLLDASDGEADAEAEAGLDQDVNPITLNPRWLQPARRIRRRACGHPSVGIHQPLRPRAKSS